MCYSRRLKPRGCGSLSRLSGSWQANAVFARRDRMNIAFRIRRLTLGALAISSFFAGLSANTHAQAAKAKQPNILVIMADDVGIWNISAYHRGMMGGRTPNIDRIASQGALFTHY